MEEIKERYELSSERIASFFLEKEGTELESREVAEYFKSVGTFILEMQKLFHLAESGGLFTLSWEELQELNKSLYADIVGEAYEKSYANPAFAVKMLGREYGRLLSFVYTEIRGMIVYAFENRLEDMTILQELFLELYACFELDRTPTYRQLQQIVYWYVSDYTDVTVTYRLREMLDPSLSFAADLICRSDLSDLRYLYYFGEYITENELETARHLNAMSGEQIQAMADTYTEGYRMGFVNGNKDLSKKKVVNIRYSLGFERMVRAAVKNFEKMGLKPVIYRAAVNSVNKKQQHKIGYYGAIPNKQYEYDHRADQSIYLDKAFVERKLGVLRAAYEKYRELAEVHAGPAVIEVFGHQPFSPASRPEAYQLSEKQQQLSVEYDNAAGRITNEYIRGEERSFTIIAYPVPEIGTQYAEIFDEIVKINTLDYKQYEKIQQCLIDALDEAEYVLIQGGNGNRTNLRVSLMPLKNPAKETKFENCVADVNIPVGEVFTSPVLKGTSGILHVSQVYLNELKYTDLEIVWKDGMAESYTCKNFDSEEENQKFIRENLLYNHDTLPLGEFAVGTNTTAYVMAQKYQISKKLPILIAEKMGPHFALGDTCYSWSEEIKVYNPDGKEVIARDNEISIQRKTDTEKAYVNCHTDITIPYEELEEISAVGKDGKKTLLILNGRFVLAGTEALNRPFES